MPGPPKRVTPAEKRLQKAAQSARRRAESVRIGSCIVEWKMLKAELGLDTDTEVARLLLESYRETEFRKRRKTEATASSPPQSSPPPSSPGTYDCGAYRTIIIKREVEDPYPSELVKTETDDFPSESDASIPNDTVLDYSLPRKDHITVKIERETM